MEPPAPLTIGMRLDRAIQSLDGLSSTQLYVAIVATTIAISYAVLSSSGAPTGGTLWEEAAAAPRTTAKAAATATTTTTGGPEPKWHILKWTNVAALALFLYSVVDFGWHCRYYIHSQDGNGVLIKFLVGWSALLCYFFGFFGVSLVHDDVALASGSSGSKDAAAEPPEDGSSRAAAAATTSNTTTNSSSFLLPSSKKQPSPIIKNSNKVILPAAKAAPVCSDPASFKPSSNSSNNNSNSSNNNNYSELSDEQVAQLVLGNQLKDHELEKRLDCDRAVAVRRAVVRAKLAPLGRAGALDKLPHAGGALDYSRVHGANCEIVVGYVPLPVGLCGPLTLNGETVFVPLATTEGCLVASTNRGCKAIAQGGGATAVVLRDGITRAPCVRMPSARQAAQLKLWCDEPHNFARLQAAFEATTSFGKLRRCTPTVAGKNVYLRLQCFSGDAMGMNMVSKGSLAVIECLKSEFPELTLVALSGNMCTDKKAAAINWIEGRGKSVVVEAVIPKDVVKSTLKTTVSAMVHTNLHKNLIGSAMAGTVGGFNAHASNIVTAVFLATGQDPAQNVESSNCITLLEEVPETGDLWASCTMPSLEVGTVGGGTSLEAQSACLQVLGCKGGGGSAGEHAQKLAQIVAAATLAGELSLLAALAANTLVAAHMQHNRKTQQQQAPSANSPATVQPAAAAAAVKK